MAWSVDYSALGVYFAPIVSPAVNNFYTIDVNSGTVYFSTGGGSWSVVPVEFGEQAHTIWGFDADNVYVISTGSNIFKLNVGHTQFDQVPATINTIHTPTDGTPGSEFLTSGGGQGLHGTSATTLYWVTRVAADGADSDLALFKSTDGGANWDEIAYFADTGTSNDTFGVWANSDSDVWTGFSSSGDGFVALHWDGATYTTHTFGSTNTAFAYEVWSPGGVDAANVYWVNFFGTLKGVWKTSNGTTFSQLAPFSTNNQSLTGVYGSSLTNIWAVGKDPTNSISAVYSSTDGASFSLDSDTIPAPFAAANSLATSLYVSSSEIFVGVFDPNSNTGGIIRKAISAPTQIVTLISIPSEESVSSPTLILGSVIQPSSIASSESFGALTISHIIRPFIVASNGDPTVGTDVLASDLIQVVFNQNMLNDVDLKNINNYIITSTDVGVQLVTVRKVFTGEEYFSKVAYLNISNFTVGATYTITVNTSIKSTSAVTLDPAKNTAEFIGRETKIDSLVKSRPSIYDTTVGSVIRSVLTAIGREDDLIGGSRFDGI